MDDPKEFRMIQTRDGVARIPRSQEGVALRDYFQNTELPKDIDRAKVFVSGTGPVLAAPDPVPWSAEHDKEAQDYADRLKAQIDEKGYYKRSLEAFAGRLADITGYPREEMQAVIVSKFDGCECRMNSPQKCRSKNPQFAC
jgi:hypothetical protein